MRSLIHSKCSERGGRWAQPRGTGGDEDRRSTSLLYVSSLRLFSTSLLYVFHLEPLRSAKIFSLDRRQQTAEHHSLGRVDRNVHLEATGCRTR